MAYNPMYEAKVNSPVTTLATGLSNVVAGTVETVVVNSGLDLPDAPNLATIGIGEQAETIRYTVKNGNELTAERGFEGATREWSAGTPVGRYYSAYDHNTFINNINTHIDDMIENKEIHGIRVNMGQLEFYYNGEWQEALPTAVQEHINAMIAEEEVHGIRVNEGKLEFYDGVEWVEALPTAVEEHINSDVSTGEPHGLRVYMGELQFHNGTDWVSVKGGGFIKNYNRIILDSDTDTVAVGVVGYNPDSDIVNVFQNSVFLSPDGDYSLIGTDIVKNSGVWESATIIDIVVTQSNYQDPNADALIVGEEEFVATEGQVLFEINSGAYAVGQNSLNLFIDGVRQPKDSFSETSSTSFTLNEGIGAGTRVIASWYEIVNVSGNITGLANLNDRIGIMSELETEEKGSLVGAVNEVDSKVVGHLAQDMPHRFLDTDTAKVYRHGLIIEDGHMKFIYEEVV